MPFSQSQHRLFEAAAHNPAVAKSKGIPQQQAATMASEGVKPASKAQVLAKALTNMKAK